MDIEPDPINARHFAEKHMTLRREMGDLDGQLMAYLHMAISEIWSGDMIQAGTLCEEGMEIARIVKNRWGLMEGHSILGYIFKTIGEVDRAIEHFKQALDIVQDTGEQGRVVQQLNALGCAYGEAGNWSQAERYIRQAILLARSNHFALWEIISCTNLAEVAFTFDHLDLAVTNYQAAAAIDRSQEYTFLDGLVAYCEGKAALLREELQAAIVSFRKALGDAAETGDRRLMKSSLQALAVCAIRSGQFERGVRLQGVIESRNWLLWPLAMPWLVPYDLDESLSAALSARGEKEYAHLYAQGQAMTPEQMVAYALEVQR
jgi:tetratricopeptide (TPR) repeat protein